MNAMKLRFLFAVVFVVASLSSMVSAQAPGPSPTFDAASVVPAATFASLTALGFGFLFR
ncbi:hypothetical protein QJS04_geneDACA001568 [Acorus gramineus]|uniref:Uncharacterized protein n=1 Tax=Acorus gramineus TaxID=55184 RepID=A0AAV9BJ60_ACOGR|nr:hypothetical protein QJS04_geneDACA001568 [Acorus gramineus]